MTDEIIIERDRIETCNGEGVVVPLDRITPDTLRRLVEEFVTREWSELGDAGYSLEVKVDQVISQLKTGTALVVFDMVTETCNIVPAETFGQRDK